MQPQRVTSLEVEQKFWQHEALLWTIRNFVSYTISILLTAGIVGPFIWWVVDGSSSPDFSQIRNLVSIVFTVGVFLTFALFPSGLNVLWNRVIQRQRFGNLSERWRMVYEHLFAIGHLDAATELKYDPFSYNGTFIKNEAQVLVQTLKKLSEKDWAKAPHRFKPAWDATSSNARALALLDSYIIETKRKQAWRWFIAAVAPLFLLALGGAIALCVLYSSLTIVYTALFLPLILLVIPLSIRFQVLENHARRFATLLAQKADCNLAMLDQLIMVKRRGDFSMIGQSFLWRPPRPSYVTRRSAQGRPILRYFRAGRYAANELWAMITYFGLPEDTVALPPKPQIKPQFDIKL